MTEIALGQHFFDVNMRARVLQFIAVFEEALADHGEDVNLSDAVDVIADEFVVQQYTLKRLVPSYSLSVPVDQTLRLAAAAALREMDSVILHAAVDEAKHQRRKQKKRLAKQKK